MNTWLTIAQTLASVIVAELPAAHQSQVQSLLNEALAVGQLATVGLQPPRSVDAIEADVQQLLAVLPASALPTDIIGSKLVAQALNVEASIHNFDGGQVVILGHYTAPRPGNPRAIIATFLEVGPAAESLGLA